MESDFLRRINELDSLADAVAHAPVLNIPGPELQTAVAKLSCLRRRIDAASNHALAALAESRSTTLTHGLRTEDWLARTARLPKRTAIQKVKVAMAVAKDLPAFDAALSDGKIELDHATKMVSVMRVENQERLREFQADLVEAAIDQPKFEAWASDTARLASQIARNAGYDPSTDVNANKLTFEPLGDGSFRGGFEFWDVRAEVARQALNREADIVYDEYCQQTNKSDKPAPGRASCLAEAFIRLVLRGAEVPSLDGRYVRPIADISLVIHANDPIGDIYTPGDVRLQDASLQALLCDAQYTPIVVNNLGEPLAHGRSKRFATPAQIKALGARDAGCVAAGCDVPAEWCDAHHVKHYKRDKGKTDIDNLALVCRCHHGLAHSSDSEMIHIRRHPDPNDDDSDPELLAERAEDAKHPNSLFKFVTSAGAVLYSQHRATQHPTRSTANARHEHTSTRSTHDIDRRTNA